MQMKDINLLDSMYNYFVLDRNIEQYKYTRDLRINKLPSILRVDEVGSNLEEIGNTIEYAIKEMQYTTNAYEKKKMYLLRDLYTSLTKCLHEILVFDLKLHNLKTYALELQLVLRTTRNKNVLEDMYTEDMIDWYAYNYLLDSKNHRSNKNILSFFEDRCYGMFQQYYGTLCKKRKSTNSLVVLLREDIMIRDKQKGRGVTPLEELQKLEIVNGVIKYLLEESPTIASTKEYTSYDFSTNKNNSLLELVLLKNDKVATFKDNEDEEDMLHNLQLLQISLELTILQYLPSIATFYEDMQYNYNFMDDKIQEILKTMEIEKNILIFLDLWNNYSKFVLKK